MNESTITLTENGQSDYQIIIHDDTDSIISQSAKILESTIYKISQASIPIINIDLQNPKKKQILLTTSEKLKPHEIAIHVQNENLLISGGSPEALRNAVYEFLEQFLGCRWFAPDAEFIPELNKITLNATLTYNYAPNINIRTVHSRLFYDHPEFAHQLKVTSEAFPFYVPSGRVHTFNKFVPEEKFYESHPEYYAMRGNKRLPTQLCLTNQEVLEMVIDSVGALFERNPEASVISVSGNDNTQFCECDQCKKIDLEEESHAGTMIRFVNAVAREFPEKQISTLAYQYTRKPCKTKPIENVLITLCSIECDRSASIPEKCADFADDLRGWKTLTDNIRIWDYTTQFTNFLAPFPNMHTLKPNIEFFEENNAKWVFEQHSNNPSELFELRSYMMAKLLWNPDLNTDDVIKEFTDGYYGEAGPFVKKYVDLIHEKIIADSDFFLFLYGDPSQAFDSYLNKDLLDQYRGFFDEAEQAVSGNPVVLKRVKRARLGVDYAVLEACRQSLSSKYDLENVDFVQPLLESFKARCDADGITMMNEMRYSVSEYYDAYKQTLDVAALPNIARGKKVTLSTKPKKYADENPLALTDGAYGGSSFYANWLGFEGNDLEAIVDLGEIREVNSINMAFLQVTNHIVFFPSEVIYSVSIDGKSFVDLKPLKNQSPLTKSSKINDVQYYELEISAEARYIKVSAKNLGTAPYWHHAAGMPSWIFADEIIVR
ncbi:carbohydrate-binding protein [Portibacter lacus]|uniref:Carbohydrate-binding protein n=2 Tax=Portibacter lacus TaxID=1099794 RepID=A0AA37WHE9_9BACT|nr:carbohydrate-binding protein [Portibacter lacus]